jgi:polygalacturonase
MNRRSLLGLGATALLAPEAGRAQQIAAARGFDVREHGAKGDGKNNDTAAIQKAIDAAFRAGGGVAYIPPGDYLSAGIEIKSNVTQVDGGWVDGVLISNIRMRNVRTPIFVRLGNRGGGQQVPVAGRLENVSIRGVDATGAILTSSITGIPDHAFCAPCVELESIWQIFWIWRSASPATRDKPLCLTGVSGLNSKANTTW